MKKLLILASIFLVYPSSIFPQLSGNGTIGSPFTGTINQNIVWYPDSYSGGTIYASTITILSGFSLTISPGLYNGGHVQFTGTTTLTIQSNAVFIINPGISVTVHRIANDGTLRMESGPNEPGVASLLHRFYSGGGTVETRLYLSGGTTAGGAYKWHYISVPTTNISATAFNTLNLAQYIESLVAASDNYPGWVAYDGYQYSTGSTLGNTFSTMTLGMGYNYHAANSSTFTLSGPLNIFDTDMPVTCGSGFPDYQGYNLIGNPFASCLDWDYIIDNYTPAYIYDAIYFTHNGLIASYVNGVGVDGGTGTIPPMQGFFVKATANSSVYLPIDARKHNLDQFRYKKKSTENYNSIADTISLVRLKLMGVSDSAELVVRFNLKATYNVDRKYDAYEFSKSTGDLNIWTNIEGIAYSINGLPFPETIIEVPVGVNLKIPGTFKLSSNEIKKLDIYNITLKDLNTNQVVDLKKGEYHEFTSEAGMIEDRFIITFTKSATDINDLRFSDKKFSVYSTPDKTVNIRLLSDESSSTTGSITIYDIGGRKVLHNTNIEWAGKGALKQIPMAMARSGVYIVVIEIGAGKYVEKVTF